MLKKWADSSGDRGDEIDAKTLYQSLYTQMSKKLLESMTGINKDPFLQIIN